MGRIELGIDFPVDIKASEKRCKEIGGDYIGQSRCRVSTGNEIPAVMQLRNSYQPLILEYGDFGPRISAIVEKWFDSPEEALEEAVFEIKRS